MATATLTQATVCGSRLACGPARIPALLVVPRVAAISLTFHLLYAANLIYFAA